MKEWMTDWMNEWTVNHLLLLTRKATALAAASLSWTRSVRPARVPEEWKMGGMNEWTDERTDEWMNEWMNEWTIPCLLLLTINATALAATPLSWTRSVRPARDPEEWKKEGRNEWTDEWMNEWMMNNSSSAAVDNKGNSFSCNILALNQVCEASQRPWRMKDGRNEWMNEWMKVRGWAEMFIGRLWCNGQIWPNMVYFQHCLPCGPLTSSIRVAALGFLWYRSSHPDPQKSPKLQIWPNHQSNTASKPSVFLCWETENNQMVPNQENMEGGQPVQSHNRAK